MDHSQKKNYITLASTISAVAVVYLHVNSCFWHFSATERYWRTANVIESFFYFAVPVFFMISGATLLDYPKKYNTKQYLLKRSKKTVIPYFFWSFLGLLFQVFIIKTIHPSDISIKYLFNGLFSGRLVSIYWFFIPLFSVYLSIPLFAFIDDKYKIKLYKYATVITLLINVILPFISRITGYSVSQYINYPIVSGYLMYVLVGYLIDRCEMEKKYQYTIYVLGLLGMLVHIFGTYQLSVEAGRIVETFKGYCNLPSFLHSVAIFTFLRYNGESIMSLKLVKRVVGVISDCTFSIYLLHWYVLATINTFAPVNLHSIVYRLFCPIVIVGICIIAT